MRRHPEKLALRPRGEAAAGAWGVAAPGELRGCAGCEPGARATDVAWAGATRALARRGACFGALSARLPEVPSATPHRGRGAALGSEGARLGLPNPRGSNYILDGAGRGSGKGSPEEDAKPKAWNLGKGGKKVEGEGKKKRAARPGKGRWGELESKRNCLENKLQKIVGM